MSFTYLIATALSLYPSRFPVNEFRIIPVGYIKILTQLNYERNTYDTRKLHFTHKLYKQRLKVKKINKTEVAYVVPLWCNNTSEHSLTPIQNKVPI